MIDFWQNCPERYYRKAYPIPRDPGYPETAWGHCLPGDEAGWYCKLDGYCDHNPKNCPLFEETEILHDCGYKLLYNKDWYYCSACDKWFEEGEVIENCNSFFTEFYLIIVFILPLGKFINKSCGIIPFKMQPIYRPGVRFRSSVHMRLIGGYNQEIIIPDRKYPICDFTPSLAVGTIY